MKDPMHGLNPLAKSAMKETIWNISYDMLQNIMKQWLELFQQNSIQVNLSDADIKRMENQESQILEQLDSLHQLAEENRKTVEITFKQQKAKCDEMTKKLILSYKTCQDMIRNKNEVASLLAQRKAMMEALQEAYDSKTRELAEIEQNVNNARKKRDEQDKLLKKWCWVPGYGAYLAFDKLFHDYEIDLHNVLRDHQALAEQMSDIQYRCHEATQQLDDCQASMKKEQSAYDAQEKEIMQTQCILQSLKDEMIHWEMILAQANMMLNKIKAASLSPDDILAMLKELNKLQQG